MSTVHKYKHVGRKATFAIKHDFSLMYVAKTESLLRIKMYGMNIQIMRVKNFLFLQLY